MSISSHENYSAKSRRVNKLVGKQPSIGYLPANQLPFWLGFILIAALIWQFVNLSLPVFLFIAFFPCVVFWLLTGNDEASFLEKFWNPKKYAEGDTILQEQVTIGTPKIKARKPLKESGSILVNPFEKEFSLVCYGQIYLQSRSVGFHLLSNQKRDMRFVFSWESAGIESELSDLEAENWLQRLESALRELPSDDRLTFEYSSFTADSDRQEQLNNLNQQQTNPLAYLIVLSQQKRVRELRDCGRRCPKSLIIRATYTLAANPHSQTEKDITSRLLRFCTSSLEMFQGEKEDSDHRRLQKMVRLAFTEGFCRLDSRLNTLAGLQAEPLNAQQLWERDYQELHNNPPPPIPQLLILDESGLHKQSHSYTHATSVLIQPELGETVIPKCDRQWVYLPAKGRYAGFMQLGKPSGFPSAKGQLRHLFEPLARNNLRDVKIITEVSLANRGIQKFNLERMTRNASELSHRARRDKTIDVGSEMRSSEAVEARMAIERGEAIVCVACGFWLYRKNPGALNTAFNYLANCYSASVTRRAREVTQNLWLQSLPFTWEGLLTQPYDRRDYYLTCEATGLLPLILPRTGDNYGLEFLSLEGGSPFRVDFIRTGMHLALFATTRGGKSVMLADIIMQFYLHGIPVVGFDFPRPTDGTSSFSDLVAVLSSLGAKAAYNDTGSCANNLLELPDLRSFPQDDRRDRFDAVIQFQIDAVTLVVMGDTTAVAADSLFEKSVHSLVSQSLHDFHDQGEIQERYEKAIASGIGTPAWDNTPTLWDYLHFAEGWMKIHVQENAEVMSEKLREAAGQILEQLRGCLKSPLGRSLGRPSSFHSDVDLFIYALRGLRSHHEAAVQALMGYGSLLRKAISCPNSAFIIDESPILFTFPAIARIVGQLCANGLKWGCRVIMSGQTATTIFNSAAGAQILQTLTLTLVGYIKPTAIDSFVEYLNFDRELVSQCATSGFAPQPRDLRSHWLVNKDGQYLRVGYYPSELLLALTANNPDEQAARTRVLSQYDHPAEGIAAFATAYSAALRNGTPLKDIAPTTVEEKV